MAYRLCWCTIRRPTKQRPAWMSPSAIYKILRALNSSPAVIRIADKWNFYRMTCRGSRISASTFCSWCSSLWSRNATPCRHISTGNRTISEGERILRSTSLAHPQGPSDGSAVSLQKQRFFQRIHFVYKYELLFQCRNARASWRSRTLLRVFPLSVVFPV